MASMLRAIDYDLDRRRPEVFHPKGGVIWNKQEPFRLVTHHWSSNFLKGFDVYQRLDEMLGIDPWRGRFEFTYVGSCRL